MKSYRALVLVGLVVIACNTYGGEKGKKSSANKSEISGQVFVVTKGRENIKLALVEISVLPEKAVSEYIKEKHIDGLHQQQALAPDIASATQAATEGQETYERLNKQLRDTPVLSSSWQSVANSELKALKARNEAKSKLDEIQSKFNFYDSPEFYFQNLPSSIASSKTDADGKFSLSLPAGKYVIAAKTGRKIYDDSETYYWLVEVDTKSSNHSLMLSNDNQAETGCNECVPLK